MFTNVYDPYHTSGGTIKFSKVSTIEMNSQYMNYDKQFSTKDFVNTFSHNPANSWRDNHSDKCVTNL